MAAAAAPTTRLLGLWPPEAAGAVQAVGTALGDANVDAAVAQIRIGGGIQFLLWMLATATLAVFVWRLRSAGTGGWSMRSPRAAALRLVPAFTVLALFL